MPGFCPPQEYVFFADESGISNDRFTVVGGLCVRKGAIPQIHQNIDAFRQEHNMNAELKWSKVSNQKEAEYRALVDLFFALNNANYLHFHSIIFDSHRANHKKFNNGDADIGLSKLYYQLILHRFSRYYPHAEGMCVCLDRRNSSTSLSDLRDMLNAGIAKTHGISGDPIKQVVSQESHDDDLLQLNDVILGAVCAARNGKHKLVTGRASKRNLAQLVLEKSGLESFEQDSARGVTRFSVWNMRPRT